MSTGTVLVIGARGVLGHAVTRAFERAGWSVLRGSRRPTGDPRDRLVDLDRPDTVAAAIAEADVAVNAVPDPALPAEEAVLERGGKVVNVAAPPAVAGRALRRRARNPRGTAVLNAGLAPGVTNLIAAELLAEHPEADEIEIALTISMSGNSGRGGGAFLHRGLTTHARHDTTEIPFPEPFGPRRAVAFAEDEDGWLGAVACGRPVRTYVAFAERVPHHALLVMNRIGVMSLLPRVAFVTGRTKEPAHDSDEPIAEHVAVLRGGRRLGTRTVRVDGDYRGTAAVSVVLANALRDGDVAAGCFDPDELFTLAELEPELAAGGIRVGGRTPVRRSRAQHPRGRPLRAR
jgi:hypothetical protein